jgi:hypothetical protein
VIFWDAGKPLIFKNFGCPPAHCSQKGGTVGGGSSNVANACFSARKEAPSPPLTAAAGACPIHPRIQQLLEEFPELVMHYILTTSRPVFAKAQHLEPATWRAAEEEFASLEKAGFASCSMLPKKDGSWWPCGNYRHINTITVPDRYPLPNLMDLSTNMDSCKVFSKIDLVKAFHQVPIAPKDRQKMAVITVQLLHRIPDHLIFLFLMVLLSDKMGYNFDLKTGNCTKKGVDFSTPIFT